MEIYASRVYKTSPFCQRTEFFYKKVREMRVSKNSGGLKTPTHKAQSEVSISLGDVHNQLEQIIHAGKSFRCAYSRCNLLFKVQNIQGLSYSVCDTSRRVMTFCSLRCCLWHKLPHSTPCQRRVTRLSKKG